MQTEDSIQDIQRLVHNQQNLLESIPEMVMLVKDSESIEYMNPSARDFFGDLRKESMKGHSASNQNVRSLLNIVAKTIQDNTIESTLETTFNEHHLEYTLAPFQGYKGDSLLWFFVRDLTETKSQLEELTLFHTSIETILSHEA